MSSSCGSALATYQSWLRASIGVPWQNTARIPVSASASSAASACSGVFMMCAKSTSVVIPASSASYAPARVAAYTSCGR